MQHTATHCSTLQHTTIRCTTLEHTKNKIPSTGTPCDRLCAYTHCNALRQNCNALQHTAAHCSTLQHTATLQAHLVTDIVPTHAATHCNTTATQCSTLQHTTTHCNTLQHTTPHSAYYSSCRHLLRQTLCTHTHCNARQHIATHCNMLRHPAAHCNTHYLKIPFLLQARLVTDFVRTERLTGGGVSASLVAAAEAAISTPKPLCLVVNHASYFSVCGCVYAIYTSTHGRHTGRDCIGFR